MFVKFSLFSHLFDSILILCFLAIETRFRYVREDDIFGYAAILDPNFRFDWLETSSKQVEWKRKLTDLLISNSNCSSVDLSLDNISFANNKCWTKLPGQNIKSNDSNNLIVDEIDRYVKTAEIFMGEHYKENKNSDVIEYANVLEFWKLNEKQFPSLARLAKKLQAIPAISAAVERFFSKTGFILRPHRRRMSDKVAEQIFFLKGNSHVLSL